MPSWTVAKARLPMPAGAGLRAFAWAGDVDVSCGTSRPHPAAGLSESCLRNCIAARHDVVYLGRFRRSYRLFALALEHPPSVALGAASRGSVTKLRKAALPPVSPPARA